ncbi:MFS transporter [Paraburkholderia phenazinium]|uniref:Transmembrane secretion effector n=1 Tax=Paraburkholderia phenazinium TaxID=60549 RepID=A0A1G8EFX0_9BURK|nr:MFS transporter [Paraburkholderia phenazinium]SDH68813.1 Transmembrane secretion effector [Paraburkholderia phenazinium]
MDSGITSGGETRAPAFRWFWLANLAIQVGGRAWTLALPVLAIQYLSADSRQVGYLTAAETVGPMLLLLPAGVWIDRMSKRYAMIFSAVSRALLIGTVPVIWLSGWLGMPSLYVIALFVGVASHFYGIAYQAYVPLLVGSGESYRANTLLTTSSRAADASTPIVIGFVMKLIGAPVVVLLDSVGYLVCAAILTRVPHKEEVHADTSKRGLRQGMIEGLRFVWSEPALRVIALAMLLSNFFATAITTLTPILVLETLRLGPAGLGVVYSSVTAGGLVGALLLGPARRKFGIGTLLTGGLVVAAGFCILTPLAASLPVNEARFGQAVLMVSMFGTAFGGVFFAVSQISLRQMLCPKDLMSRVNATMRFVVWGTMPLASMAAGLSAHMFGLVPTMWIAALGTIVTVFPIHGISRHVPSQFGDAAKSLG